MDSAYAARSSMIRKTSLGRLGLVVAVWGVSACGGTDNAVTSPSFAPSASVANSLTAASLPTTSGSGSSDTSVPPQEQPPIPTTFTDVSDDVVFESVAAMAEASELVVTGQVVAVDRVLTVDVPGEEDDPQSPSEWVGIVVRPDRTLRGANLDQVTLVWEAYILNEQGERTLEVITDGFPTPHIGDRLLLFLVSESSARQARFSGAPTHRPVTLDGFAFLDGDEVAAVRVDGPGPADQLLGASVAEVASAVDE